MPPSGEAPVSSAAVPVEGPLEASPSGEAPALDTSPPLGAPPPRAVPGTSAIPRWVLAERLAHWLYALLFITAFVSGLLIWIPETRNWMGGVRWTLSKYHAGVGFAMVMLPLLVMLVFDRRRLVRGVREVGSWAANDRRWLWAALRGHTLRGRPMPAQGRLNAGQKASTILVAVMAVGFAATGVVLLGRAELPAGLVSWAFGLHDFLAVAGVALLAGHLAHVFLTKHGRLYLGAMVRGALPEEVARECHQTWWEAQVRNSDRPPGSIGAGENDRPPPGE